MERVGDNLARVHHARLDHLGVQPAAIGPEWRGPPPYESNTAADDRRLEPVPAGFVRAEVCGDAADGGMTCGSAGRRQHRDVGGVVLGQITVDVAPQAATEVIIEHLLDRSAADRTVGRPETDTPPIGSSTARSTVPMSPMPRWRSWDRSSSMVS
jgi:hypothetical protein